MALLVFTGLMKGLAVPALAASITVVPDSDYVYVGDTVKVTITATSVNEIGAYYGEIGCDGIFSGFTGRFAEGCEGGKQVSFSYEYKAKKAGRGKITVTGVEVAVDDPDYPDDPMKIIKEAAPDAACTVTVLKRVPPFNDVKNQKVWFYEPVYRIAGLINGKGNALMSGYDDGSGNFGPADPLTRQDFAVILYRLADEPGVKLTANPFPDADQKGYYYKSIFWAKNKNVIAGYDDGRFGVGDNITREQVATILYRYAKSYLKKDVTKTKGDLKKFKDYKSVSKFASDALAWASGAGIIKGKNNGTRIDPQGNAARAEIAAMILRFIDYMNVN